MDSVVNEKVNKIVKTPRWNEAKQAYICQHCGGVVSEPNMAYGFTCKQCGMPIHEI